MRCALAGAVTALWRALTALRGYQGAQALVRGPSKLLGRAARRHPTRAGGGHGQVAPTRRAPGHITHRRHPHGNHGAQGRTLTRVRRYNSPLLRDELWAFSPGAAARAGPSVLTPPQAHLPAAPAYGLSAARVELSCM